MNIGTVDFKDPKAPQEVVRSLKETGFVVIKNHPISEALIKSVYQEWEKFFASPDKAKYTFDPKNQTGYFPFKSENAADSKIKDLKEFYHLYKEKDLPEGMSSKTWELRQQLNSIGEVLLQWINDNVPEEVRANFTEPLPNMIKGSEQTLFRLLHYPPLGDDVEEGAVRAFSHQDSNLITALISAAGPNGEYKVGSKTGLEVKDLSGNWHEVECDPNSIIFNCGDFLQDCTGGYLVSTPHQVKNPIGEGSNLSRYSCPLFIHPRPEVFITKDKTAQEALDQRLREIGLKK